MNRHRNKMQIYCFLSFEDSFLFGGNCNWIIINVLLQLLAFVSYFNITRITYVLEYCINTVQTFKCIPRHNRRFRSFYAKCSGLFIYLSIYICPLSLPLAQFFNLLFVYEYYCSYGWLYSTCTLWNRLKLVDWNGRIPLPIGI